jgi:hypothetical protein
MNEGSCFALPEYLVYVERCELYRVVWISGIYRRTKRPVLERPMSESSRHLTSKSRSHVRGHLLKALLNTSNQCQFQNYAQNDARQYSRPHITIYTAILCTTLLIILLDRYWESLQLVERGRRSSAAYVTPLSLPIQTLYQHCSYLIQY